MRSKAGSMRVISGSAKHLPLKTIKGMDTRPTTDRIKETLFNMIQSDIPGCRFLDLFAGSGAIGIEALSRGAECAVFVEQNSAAAAVIRDNLAFTRLAERGRVIVRDVLHAGAELAGEQPFDVIFLDPPYRKDFEPPVLEMLLKNGLADEHSLIIIEAALDTEFSWLEAAGYELVKYKKYKTNAHVFVSPKSNI
ncbi:MAG: 16S rRNA (guanine(966)-N(2))-methyltransferase RsmD [Eubacteriales bacterium]|nr:16S rRNA (guanine(966)-N(2))-methyltransferase RsmD [Eubacteriales bacterium]